MTRLLFPKQPPLFTTKQFQRISNILDSAGQTTLGVTVLEQLFSKGSSSLGSIIIGTIAVTVLWISSILFAKKGGA